MAWTDDSGGSAAAPAAPATGRDPRGPSRALIGAIALAPALYFWPAVLGRVLLAPGDGITYHFPLAVLCGRLFRDREWPLWNPYLFAGFPLLATIQSGAAYPGTLLFALLPPVAAMNLLVISSYSLAATFTFAYARAIGADRIGAALAALTFSLGGFLVAHLAHTTIVHSAAFLPLLLWALERLRRRPRARFAVAGALAIALQICGGHPQIPVYSLMLAGAYVTFFAIADPPPAGRSRYVLWAAATVVLGLMLAAVQLVPTAELSRESVRARLPYDAFTSFSLPFGALAGLVFPELLSPIGPIALEQGREPGAWSVAESGAAIAVAVLALAIVSWRRTASGEARRRLAVPAAGALALLALGGLLGLHDRPEWGPWNFVEIGGYVGIAPLVLAIGALPRARSDRRLCFWYLAAGGSLLLALGGYTPLARVLYHVPVYNLFRAPARHLLELDFALAVIAGLVSSRPTAASERRPMMAAALAVAGSIVIVVLAAPSLLPARALATRALVLPLAVGVPTALFTAWTVRSPTPRRRALLLAVQLVDLLLFARNEVWTMLPGAAGPPPLPYARFLRSARADLGDARIALIAHDAPMSAALAMGTYDLPAYWQIPSIQGYEQLMLSRYARFAGDMGPAGEISIPRVLQSPGFLDVLGVKYAILWTGSDARTITRSGIDFDAAPMDFTPSPARPVRLALPSPRRATAVALVSALGDSVDVADGTPVARVVVEGSRGEVVEAFVRAGVHTAEWAWDRPDVRRKVRHRRAAIAEDLVSDGARGHLYLGVVELGRAIDVEALRLESLQTAMTIRRLSLYDAENERSYPLTGVHRMWRAVADATRWRAAWSDERASILENRRVLPRAWMVSEVISLDAERALAVIVSGKLPDGRDFDPRATALADTGAGLAARGARGGGSVEIVGRSAHSIEMVAHSSGPGFLVASEIDYPGWKALVDGVETRIVRTDSVLRGLEVPAGEHHVRFVFRSSSVKLGAAVSLAALLLAAGMLWSDARRIDRRSA